ncbi:hypothetical protein [Acetobacter senegalensis]|uniref:hypothetical protein n=1 Tax=Acetobacter senegalensis TaxID=446692 RepID=UPI000A4189BC|nr:hypothetical protein [Acetobacter senegalensis]
MIETEPSNLSKTMYAVYFVVSILFLFPITYLYGTELIDYVNKYAKTISATSGLYSAVYWLSSARNETKKIYNSCAALLSAATVAFGAINIPKNWFYADGILGVSLLLFGISMAVTTFFVLFFPDTRDSLLGRKDA